MFKIRHSFLLLIVFSFIVVLLVNGCEKAECKVASDCSQRSCSTATCEDKQCKYIPIANCCGNGIEDAVENGKPGNSCTCPRDYGSCEGKVQIKYGSRTRDSEYLKYICSQNEECVLGIESSTVRPVTLLDEREFSFFKFETTVTYNQPFDVTKDTFAFRISLIDDNEDLVFPIKLKKILVKGGEVLFGEQELNLELGGVGDSITVNVPLFYKLEQPEENRALTYRIAYDYTKKTKGQRLSDGSYETVEQLVRDDYEKRFNTQITFVSSGASK